MKFRKIIYSTTPAGELVLDRAWNAYKDEISISREKYCEIMEDGLQGYRWEDVEEYIYNKTLELKRSNEI